MITTLPLAFPEPNVAIPVALIRDLTWRRTGHARARVLQDRFELRDDRLYVRRPLAAHDGPGHRLELLAEGVLTALDATALLIGWGLVECPTCQGRCREVGGHRPTVAA